jgi:hypothetical protein
MKETLAKKKGQPEGLARTKLARKGERSLAGSTRLELATSGVTGRRSNQLNYDPAGVIRRKTETGRRKSENGLSSVLLLSSVFFLPSFCNARVGGTGLEPVTAGV